MEKLTCETVSDCEIKFHLCMFYAYSLAVSSPFFSITSFWIILRKYLNTTFHKGVSRSEHGRLFMWSCEHPLVNIDFPSKL